MFLLSFFKTKMFFLMYKPPPVFTEIRVPKPKFGSGVSHSVHISATMSEDKDIKQLS